MLFPVCPLFSAICCAWACKPVWSNPITPVELCQFCLKLNHLNSFLEPQGSAWHGSCPPAGPPSTPLFFYLVSSDICKAVLMGAKAQGPKGLFTQMPRSLRADAGPVYQHHWGLWIKSKFLSPPKACWIRVSASEAQKPALLTASQSDSHTPKSKKDHPRFIKFHTYPHAYKIMIAKIFIEHLRCARSILMY